MGRVRTLNLIGQTFGRLTVIAQAPTVHYSQWRCRCTCGGEKVVSSKMLRGGWAKSCGCLRRESAHAAARVGAAYERATRRHAVPPVTGACALADAWPVPMNAWPPQS